MFVENSQGEFELGGVLHAISGSSFTFFSDIGNPLTTYRDQILDLYEDDNYSIEGDVNLDGITNEEDLFALAAGWTDAVSTADITTWVRGDLNQDGDTDLADFAILRDALGGSVNLSQLSAAIAEVTSGVVVIPEPAGLALASSVLLLLGARRRRR